MSHIRFANNDTILKFRTVNSIFYDGSIVIDELIESLFGKYFSRTEISDFVVYLMGYRCTKDFREIGLLAECGYGWGATSHLRSMYERVVTMTYIHQFPSEAQKFANFSFIQRWKVANALNESFGISPENDKEMEELTEQYELLKNEYLIDKCKKCETKRVNHTWSKLDIVSMAKKVGGLEESIVPAYYIPMQQTHSTFGSIGDLLKYGEDGKLQIDIDRGRDNGIRSFSYAHLLLLKVFEIQIDHFEQYDDVILYEEAMDHYMQSWLPKVR